MRELLLAFLIFVGLAGLAWAVQSAGTTTMVYGGVILILFGLLFSTPCAVWYHVLLYRSLKPRGALDRKWLWNPTAQHRHLSADEKRRVMPWFYAGASGWGISVVGCVMLGISALMMRGS